mmetsp:Transcript_8409/g.20855  ORF Transcript_8409/g.20855 Transcript_8409/m.20855 type:complete len:367 (+) Transcript_8409:53-1153(+)
MDDGELRGRCSCVFFTKPKAVSIPPAPVCDVASAPTQQSMVIVAVEDKDALAAGAQSGQSTVAVTSFPQTTSAESSPCDTSPSRDSLFVRLDQSPGPNPAAGDDGLFGSDPGQEEIDTGYLDVSVGAPAVCPAMTAPPRPSSSGFRRGGNPNAPSAFAWLRPLLSDIAAGNGPRVTDTDTGESGTLAFVVAGSCPNTVCGMQAVAYAVMDSGKIDFWWVKPRADCAGELEAGTLHRHSHGPFKNDPGKSRAVYQALADFFAGTGPSQDGTSFEVQSVNGTARGCLCLSGSVRPIVLIWQEEYSGLLSWSKFVHGQIMYQPLLDGQCGPFFLSQCYSIRDGGVSIPVRAEWPHDDVIPSVDIHWLPK